MRPGDVVAGRYRLDRLLGEGGMGSVWAATHTVTGRTHALKLLKKEDDDPATRKRMLREARAASAVKHPNVVAIHDVIEGPDGAPVLVMDLLAGESLGERLEREGRLVPSEALRIVRAILEALAAAHEAGVIHRDLKPDNVFLTPDGVKIVDFGIAKLTANDGLGRATTNLVTESGTMLGTPCYMAPEQAFGEGVLDARADLWAVGAVLYECLAGVRPADGATLGQVLKILATGAIVPIEQRVPDLPADVAALVGRLLATDRDARPATAREVLCALDALGSRVALSAADAVEPAMAEERAKPRRRGPMALAGVVAALAALAVTAFVAYPRAAQVASATEKSARVEYAPRPDEAPTAANTAVARADVPLAPAPTAAPNAPYAPNAPKTSASPAARARAPASSASPAATSPAATAATAARAKARPPEKPDSKLLTDLPF